MAFNKDPSFIGVAIFTSGISKKYAGKIHGEVEAGLRCKEPGKYGATEVYSPTDENRPLNLPQRLPSGKFTDTTTGTPRKRPASFSASMVMQSKEGQEVEMVFFTGRPSKKPRPNPPECAAVSAVLPSLSTSCVKNSLLIPPGSIRDSREEQSCLDPRPFTQEDVTGVPAIKALCGAFGQGQDAHWGHDIGRAITVRATDHEPTPAEIRDHLFAISPGCNLSTDRRIDGLAEKASDMPEAATTPLMVTVSSELLPDPTQPGKFLHIATEQTTEMHFVAEPGADATEKSVMFTVNPFAEAPFKHTYGFFPQVVLPAINPATKALTPQDDVRPGKKYIF